MHAFVLAFQLTAAVSAATASVDADVVHAATVEAARIWAAHVDLQFVGAERSGHGADVTVVITDTALSSGDDETSGIGQIRFSAPGVPANTIYLSVAGAKRLAAQTVWRNLSLEQLPARIRSQFLTHALGRALAHEIGHYLLRSSSHATRGLMRARYLTAELLDADLRPYALTATQAVAVRREREAALLARSTPPKH